MLTSPALTFATDPTATSMLERTSRFTCVTASGIGGQTIFAADAADATARVSPKRVFFIVAAPI